MESIQSKMQMVGYHTFQNKEKTKRFFIIQCLSTKKVKDDLKSTVVNIFVEPTEYSEISAMDFGSEITVETSINFETNKPTHKIIL